MDKKFRKKYLFLRICLFVGASLGAVFLIFSIVFPDNQFSFNFKNPRATKNTLASPRNENSDSLEEGKINVKEKLIFDAGVIGNFSQAEVKFFLEKELSEESFLEVKKGYQAFLFPEGGEKGFADGILLKNDNDYYFVSQGLLREFRDKNQFLQMGFSQQKFLEINEEDLKYNSLGEKIEQNYPIGTVFKVESQYYRQEGEYLRKFISPEAYFSYGEDLSVSKDFSWLLDQEVLEEKIGFSSGSLLAYGTSAFVVSENLLLPIGDATIFESKGFLWGDLISIGGDVTSFYEKGKLFELDSPHPSGTVFFTKDTQKYYLVENNKKYLLPTEKIAKNWIKKAPVSVLQKSLNSEKECSLNVKKTFWGKKYLHCALSVEDLNSLLGTDYEFYVKGDADLEFSMAEVVLKKNVNKTNFDIFLNNILGRIRQHYDK